MNLPRIKAFGVFVAHGAGAGHYDRRVDRRIAAYIATPMPRYPDDRPSRARSGIDVARVPAAEIGIRGVAAMAGDGEDAGTRGTADVEGRARNRCGPVDDAIVIAACPCRAPIGAVTRSAPACSDPVLCLKVPNSGIRCTVPA